MSTINISSARTGRKILTSTMLNVLTTVEVETKYLPGTGTVDKLL